MTIDVGKFVAEETARFQALLASSDLQGLVERYPIRETPAFTEIARRLGFQDRTQYEDAVRKLLLDDVEALQCVRGLLGSLHQAITSAQ